MKLEKITIFTDGAAKGNPGPGGWGAVIFKGKERFELSGGFAHTTNNRMEILACVKALEFCFENFPAQCAVEISTDSKFVKNGVELWLAGWLKNGWRTAARKPVKNQDLWQSLNKIIVQNFSNRVKFKHVPAHTGIVENERADFLATQAATQSNLPPDHGFALEKQKQNQFDF